jgi:hypothetical protein
MPFKKGNKLGKGRPKGAGNKLPMALKDMIMGALAGVGGQDYLEAQATKNPAVFLSLVGRVLPLQVKEGGDDPKVPTVVKHVHEG